MSRYNINIIVQRNNSSSKIRKENPIMVGYKNYGYCIEFNKLRLAHWYSRLSEDTINRINPFLNKLNEQQILNIREENLQKIK
jgi:hypothetical protein